MEIRNSIVEKGQKNEINNNLNFIQLNLSIINNIISLLTLMMISWIAINAIMNYALGVSILTQCLLLGYMFYIKYKRKINTQKTQIKEEEKHKQQQIPFSFIQNYLIKTNKFELIYLSVIQSLYISIFEVVIHDNSTKQQGMIISLFISLFINAQLKGLDESNFNFVYTSLFQIYTLARIQLFYSFNYFDFILNILYSIYQTTYLNNFVTQKKEHKNIKKNHKAKTELTMRLYKSILSIIPDGLAVINQDRKLVYANPTLKKILQTNKKNDILSVLMNLGNNNQSQNQQNTPDKTKVKIDLKEKKKIIPEEKISDFKEQKFQEYNNIVKLQKVNYEDKIVEKKLEVESEIFQIVKQDFQQNQEEIKLQEMQIDEVKQEKNSFIAQCSIDHQYVYGQINQEQFDDDENVKTLKLSNSSLNQINNNKIENKDALFKTLQSQIEENKYSNQCIYHNNSQNTCNQINSSSHSVVSSIGRVKSQKIKDSRHEYSSKYRTVYNRDSTKNMMSQSNQYASENSEILSYQGFGIIIGEDESQLHQVPQTPKIQSYIKRKSENYSVRASLDQNSVLSFSQKQQNQKSPMKNSYSNVSVFSSVNRQIQKKQSTFHQNQPLEELSECQQISQESDRNIVNQSVYVRCQSENEQVYTERSNHISNNLNSSINNQVKTFQNKLSKNFIPNKENRLNQSGQFLISNNETSNQNITKKSINNKGFGLKLQTKKHLTQTNIDSKIVMKKTDVLDVINIIFKSQNTKKIDNEHSIMNAKIEELNDQNQKEGNIENQEKQNLNNIPFENSKYFLQNQSQSKIVLQSNEKQPSPKRRQSFTTELNKEQKDFTYLQQQDNVIKIQVKYKDKDLVIQFLSVDVLTEDSKKDSVILVMVQDMWKDLYQKKVQDLQKDKMRMFASLSHELRTPLNCSISMLEVLRDEIQVTNPSYIEEYLNPALFSNKLLLNQINDILDFVQMDSGKFKYSFFDFNILGLLKDCQKLISMQASMKNLEIRICIDYNVPELICSDPNRIRQIILNFLSNSLKFTKSGYIAMGVSKISEKTFKLYVKDTGIGITKENLETIFSFCAKVSYSQICLISPQQMQYIFKNNNLQVKYEKKDEGLNNQGCGLGLTISNSIAKGLVKDHFEEGGITVESVYGEGSTFSILFQDMNINAREDFVKDIKSQLSKSNSIGKRQSRIHSLAQKDEEILNHRLSFLSENQNINHKRGSYILSPTKIGKKKQINNLINPSQVIFEDNSVADSQNTSVDPLKIANKKSSFNKEELSFTDFKKFLYSKVSDKASFDSTMIIDDDNENCQHISFQPNLHIKQHYFNKNYEDDNISKQAEKKNKIRSPTTKSNKSQKIQLELTSQQSCDYKIKKSDSNSHVTTENFPSVRYLESSQNPQEEINIVSAPNIDVNKKYSKVCSSLTNTKNIKSANSFKTQITDQLEQQKSSFQEQEGFISYIGGYNNKVIESFSPVSSKVVIRSFTGLDKIVSVKSQVYTSQINLQYNGLDKSLQEEKIIKASDIDNQAINLNPQDTINEIIKKNNLKKQKCNCPQIVIVDDNQFNLYALSKTVQQFSFSCLQISDSVQAVDDLKDMYFNNCCVVPKIIFMDIEMPIKNGYQVAFEINKFYESIQLEQTPAIIACTAYVGQEDRDKAINAGMDDFINKPILKTAFQQLILNWSKLFL